MSTGFAPQQQFQSSNPFGPPQPLQPNHTGAGFGGYTPQPPTTSQGFPAPLPPIPQDGIASFQRPMHTGPARANNPFRQSMLPAAQNPMPATAPLQRQNTNPFAKHTTGGPPPFNGGASPFSSPPPSQTPGQLQPLQQQRTGTNPFAKNPNPPGQQLQPPAAAPLRPNLTGTNPFRQSAFISQQTGQGWQNGVPQGTVGGLEKQATIPIFPRP
jgi:hypothetical protein